MIYKIKLIHNNKQYSHSSTVPIFSIDNNNDNINNNSLQAITKEFTETITQKEHQIVCLKEQINKCFNEMVWVLSVSVIFTNNDNTGAASSSKLLNGYGMSTPSICNSCGTSEVAI